MIWKGGVGERAFETKHRWYKRYFLRTTDVYHPKESDTERDDNCLRSKTLPDITDLPVLPTIIDLVGETTVHTEGYSKRKCKGKITV